MVAAVTAPICPCGSKTRLTTGREIYHGRDDLADSPIWVCMAPQCDGRVGCHPGTTRPLGVPAAAPLRRARRILHDQKLDPLWQTAPGDDKAKHRARGHLYAFLAVELGINGKKMHTAELDLDGCRRAWRVLEGKTMADIDAWYAVHKAAVAAEKAKAAP